MCNKTIKSRYTKTKKASINDCLRAGTQELRIEFYKTINIIARSPQNISEIKFNKIVFISNFKTNLVSLEKMIAKGIYIDTHKIYFYKDSKTLFYINRINRIIVFEYIIR